MSRTIVEVRDPNTGHFKSFFYCDARCTQPTVFESEKRAKAVTAEVMIKLCLTTFMREGTVEGLPDPDDFRFVDVDQEPTEPEVESLVDAELALGLLRKKGVI